MSTFIYTASGRKVNLLHPNADDIDLHDIKHHLAQINRYTGATTVPYSVAEHACRVARFVQTHGGSMNTALLALHHDDTEAYLGDMSSPLKRIQPEYQALEEQMDREVHKALGLPMPTRPQATIIRAADLALLCWEWTHLMPPGATLSPEYRSSLDDAKPGLWSYGPIGMKPTDSRALFELIHYSLGGTHG